MDEFLPLLLDSVELNFRTADDPDGVRSLLDGGLLVHVRAANTSISRSCVFPCYRRNRRVHSA
jgi:hypothetical protein